MAFTQLAWDMNGLAAIADSTTPVCVAGITGTASDVTLSTASLHGDVDIGGQGTTYHFEYGNNPDISTPTQTAVPGPQETVSEPVTDLAPGNPYHFRLVATNSDGTTQGDLVTFATHAAPPPPITVTTTTTVTVSTTVTVTGARTTVTVPGPTKTRHDTRPDDHRHRHRNPYCRRHVEADADNRRGLWPHAVRRGSSLHAARRRGVALTTSRSAHVDVVARRRA